MSTVRNPEASADRRRRYDAAVADVTSSTGRRYRCTSCGNLTRFDVTATRRTRSFHHYTVGGELTVERAELLAEDVESVECTWCGPTGNVQPLTGA